MNRTVASVVAAVMLYAMVVLAFEVGDGTATTQPVLWANLGGAKIEFIGWNQTDGCMRLFQPVCGDSSFISDATGGFFVGQPPTNVSLDSAGLRIGSDTVVGDFFGTNAILAPLGVFTTAIVHGTNGTAVTERITGNVSVDIGAIAALSTATTTVAVTNLQADSACACSFRTDPVDDYIMKDCYSTAGNINVRMYNTLAITGADPAAVTMDFDCSKS